MKYQVFLASIMIGAASPGFSSGITADIVDCQSDPTTVRETPERPLFGDDWPRGRGREITGALCGSCHSLAIVKQQSLSRADWDELLDWMVEEQGMVSLESTIRINILNYLATHFGVSRN